jgi:hypothetical protein
LIKKFAKLVDLELIITFDVDHTPEYKDDRAGYSSVRGHILTGLLKLLQGEFKLSTTRTSYAGVNWAASRNHTGLIIVYMGKVMRRKTGAGWRIDMASSHSLTARQRLEEARKLGMRIKATTHCGVSSHILTVAVEPVSGQGGDLTGYRVIGGSVDDANVYPLEEVPETTAEW